MKLKSNRLLKMVLATSAIGLSIPIASHATLIDRGNGMIYDQDKNITWLSESRSFYQLYVESGYTQGSADGKARWASTWIWIDILNAENFKGGSGWRLPSALNGDGTLCTGANCTDSEIGDLYYDELGCKLNVGFHRCSQSVGWKTTYGFGVSSYWLSRGSRDFSQSAVFYSTGNQVLHEYYWLKTYTFTPWLVHDGDLGAPAVTGNTGNGNTGAPISVPEPGSLVLLGLAGLAGMQRRRA